MGRAGEVGIEGGQGSHGAEGLALGTPGWSFCSSVASQGWMPGRHRKMTEAGRKWPCGHILKPRGSGGDGARGPV